MSRNSQPVPMSESDINTLRLRGVLGATETALYLAEACWAEDTVTGARRRLFVDGVMLESKRSVLHD